MNTKLGPRPDTDSFPGDGDFYFEMMLWERRRAERAEALLKEATVPVHKWESRHVGQARSAKHEHNSVFHAKIAVKMRSLLNRIEAHFTEVAP